MGMGVVPAPSKKKIFKPIFALEDSLGRRTHRHTNAFSLSLSLSLLGSFYGGWGWFPHRQKGFTRRPSYLQIWAVCKQIFAFRALDFEKTPVPQKGDSLACFKTACNEGQFLLSKPWKVGEGYLSCDPPDPLQSPETGNPENTIFETKKWTFGGSPLDPFK